MPEVSAVLPLTEPLLGQDGLRT